MNKQKTEFVCPSCNGGYNEPIAVKNSDGIDHHECPHCGEYMSVRFTEEKNVENCTHSATVDGFDGQTHVEQCSSCGLTWESPHNKRTGIKSAWNAADGKM